MEIESIKTYKKDLLDDIQVHVCLNPRRSPPFLLRKQALKAFVSLLTVQKLKMEIENVMAEILSFESAEEK